MGNRITVVIGGSRSQTLDTDDFIDALRLAGDGDSILLEEGSYELLSPLSINRSVFISGLGRGAVLSGPATTAPLVEWNAPGGQIANISLVQNNNNLRFAQNVALGIRSGSPVIKLCTFRTFSKAETVRISGISSPMFFQCRFAHSESGMRIEETAKTTLLQCEFMSNHSNGLEVRDSALADVLDCVFQNSFGSALRIYGHASTKVCNSQLNENRGNAVHVGDTSKLRLIKCFIQGNGLEGICVQDIAAVQVIGGFCSGNGGWNAIAQDHSRLDILCCHLEGADAAVFYANHSRGTLRNCKLHDDHGGRFSCDESASPVLVSSEIDDDVDTNVVLPSPSTIPAAPHQRRSRNAGIKGSIVSLTTPSWKEEKLMMKKSLARLRSHGEGNPSSSACDNSESLISKTATGSLESPGSTPMMPT